MLLWGNLGAQCGRKSILLAALAIYGFSSIALPASSGIMSFIFLRFIQGIGASGISVMARVLMRDHFSGSLLAKGLSWLSISFVVSLGVGQYLGSILQSEWGWQAIFYFLAGSALLILLALLRVPFSNKIDREKIRSSWYIYIDILRHRDFLLPALAGGLGYGVIIAFNTVAPLILQGSFHWTANEYGLLGWPISAAYFFGAMSVNKFVVKTGRFRLMNMGLSLVLCGSVLMIFGSLFATTLALAVWLPYCLAVFGQAMNYPISLSVANDRASINGAYAMALSGFIHQLMAAVIGGMASFLPSQFTWPLALLITTFALGAFVCGILCSRSEMEESVLS